MALYAHGLHTCYNGAGTEALQVMRRQANRKSVPQFGLQAATPPAHEAGIASNRRSALLRVNVVHKMSLVHTARQATRVGGIRKSLREPARTHGVPKMNSFRDWDLSRQQR